MPDKVVNRKSKKSTTKHENIGLFSVRHAESSFEDPSKQNVINDSKENMAVRGVDNHFWTVFALSQIVGLACVAVVAYWGHQNGGYSWYADANKQFWVHPLLMVLGLIFFYGDAILVYRVFYFLPKFLLKLIHAALHILAIVSSSIGLAAVFENHRRTKKADLYSLHSWIGIAAFGFFCLQYVGSFVTFLFPGLSPTIRAKIMPWHRFFGVGIFVLSISAAQMGITQRLLWTDGYTKGLFPAPGVTGNVLGLLLVAFGFSVVYLATHHQYKRQPLPSDS